MNFTISATQSNIWKRFKLHYVVAAAGLVLAAGVAVGLSERGSSSPPAVGPSQASVEPGLPRASHLSQLLVYVVGSEDEKRALEQSVTTDPGWFLDSAAGKDTAVRVIVIQPDAEGSLADLATLLPEAAITTGNGPSLKFVDMR